MFTQGTRTLYLFCLLQQIFDSLAKYSCNPKYFHVLYSEHNSLKRNIFKILNKNKSYFNASVMCLRALNKLHLYLHLYASLCLYQLKTSKFLSSNVDEVTVHIICTDVVLACFLSAA